MGNASGEGTAARGGAATVERDTHAAGSGEEATVVGKVASGVGEDQHCCDGEDQGWRAAVEGKEGGEHGEVGEEHH